MKKFFSKINPIIFVLIYFAAVAIIFLTIFIYYLVLGNSLYGETYDTQAEYYDDEQSFREAISPENEISGHSNAQFVRGVSKEIWFDDNNIWAISDTGGVLTEKGRNVRSNSAVCIKINASAWYSDTEGTYYIDGNILFDDSHANLFTFIKNETRDAFAVTWGGDGAFGIFPSAGKENYRIDGTYSNGDSVQFSQVDFAENGIIVDFDERQGNDYIRNARFSLALKRKNTVQNNQTNLLLTYCHTFGTTNYLQTVLTDSSINASEPYMLTSDKNYWNMVIDLGDILNY